MDWFHLIFQNSSKNLHFINEESQANPLFALENLVNVSHFLPIPFASRLLSQNIVLYKSWVKQNIPAALPSRSKWDTLQIGLFESNLLVQFAELSESNPTRCKTKSSSPFVIHKALATPKKDRRLIHTLSSDPDKIVLVWPDNGDQRMTGGCHKNVFYGKSHCEYLGEKNFHRCLRCLDNSGVLTSDQFAKMLIFLFSFMPERMMDAVMKSIYQIYSEVPRFDTRLTLMSHISNQSELANVKRVVDWQYDDDPDLDVNKINSLFWSNLGLEVKRAVLEVSSIQSEDNVENFAVFEAILNFEFIRLRLNGSYSLHIISPNDKVFGKKNMD